MGLSFHLHARECHLPTVCMCLLRVTGTPQALEKAVCRLLLTMSQLQSTLPLVMDTSVLHELAKGYLNESALAIGGRLVEDEAQGGLKLQPSTIGRIVGSGRLVYDAVLPIGGRHVYDAATLK